MLRFTEEILLLLHSEDRGDFAPSLAPHSLHTVLAGAVLMDLALENRIDTDPEHLILVDATPLADDLLDPTLADIARDADARDASYWVAQTAKRGDEIRDKALARLVNRGILESESEGIFFLSRLVSRSRRYPTIDEQTVEEVQLRIMRVLFTDEIPNPRDIVIICLADACSLFENILSRSELDEVRNRIELIRKMDLIGQSVTEAIRKLERAPSTAPRQPKESLPQAPGLPLVGNIISMSRNLRTFIAEQYRKLGPIFAIQAFNHRLIVLAGPEANIFVSRGNQYFRNYETWSAFNTKLGVSRSPISIDGPEHIRMRRDHAQVYSRKLIENHIEDAVRIVQRDIGQWPQNKPFEALRACQHIITQQIGYLATGMSPQDYIDDIIYFSNMMISIHLSRHVPKQMMYLPRFRRSRKRVEEFLQKIIAEHDPEKRRDKPRDFVDDLLELNRTDPHYIAQADFNVYLLAPYIAGLDTAASVCAFMLYELLKNPDILDQTIAEADTLFAEGMPSMRDLRQLDVIHRVAMETMRLYPLAPAILRTAANSFEFAGYTVPAGASVLTAFTIPHLMPEYFPNPQRFDIERYTTKRAEHKQRGVYVPFGVGAHQCLGRSLAEALIAINVAYIVHSTTLALEPPNYKIKTRQLPGLHPHRSLKFRLMSRCR